MKFITPAIDVTLPVSGERMLKMIEKIARKCYQTEHRIDETSHVKFLRKIIDNGHHSTIEHVGFTIDLTNDRGVSHEEVRHRLCAISQESTRYANYSKDQFGSEISVIPPFFFDPNDELQDIKVPSIMSAYTELNPDKAIMGQPATFKMNSFDVWYLTCLWSEWGYMALINQFKRTPSEARSVLPNSLKTNLAMTANLREWRHIFNLRALGTSGVPHPQIRQVMLPALKIVQEQIPIIFDDIYDACIDKGLYEQDFGICETQLSFM